MSFDLNLVPKIRISPDSEDNVDIVKSFIHYLLYVNGQRQMVLNLYSSKEIKEMYSCYDLAYGDVLLSGLGFGILPLWIAQKPTVKSVTVVEISESVKNLFLKRNKLPDNVSIVIEDFDNFKTDKYYDCVIPDHYEQNYYKYRIKQLQNIAKNIPNHKLFWCWSMEWLYIRSIFNKENVESFVFDKDNVSGKWKDFKKIMGIDTIPDLDDKTLNKYVYTYCDIMDSPHVKGE